MINAVFYRNQDSEIIGFCVSGHAGFANSGKDIVCAAVSAMSSLVVNTLEEIFHCGGEVQASESGKLSYFLPDSMASSTTAVGVLSGFKLQLEDYAAVYPKNINVGLKESE